MNKSSAVRIHHRTVFKKSIHELHCIIYLPHHSSWLLETTVPKPNPCMNCCKSHHDQTTTKPPTHNKNSIRLHMACPNEDKQVVLDEDDSRWFKKMKMIKLSTENNWQCLR